MDSESKGMDMFLLFCLWKVVVLFVESGLSCFLDVSSYVRVAAAAVAAAVAAAIDFFNKV